MATEAPIRISPWSYVLRGVIALVFAAIMLFQPVVGVASFVFAYGVFALLDGLVAIVAAFVSRRRSGFEWSLFFMGLLGIIVGLFFLFRPLASVVVLVMVIGAWFAIAGISSIVSAIRHRKQITGEWLIVIVAIFPVLFGLYLLLFPIVGIPVLPVLIGSFALFWGLMLLLTAFRLWRHGRSRAVAG